MIGHLWMVMAIRKNIFELFFLQLRAYAHKYFLEVHLQHSMFALQFEACPILKNLLSSYLNLKLGCFQYLFERFRKFFLPMNYHSSCLNLTRTAYISFSS